MARVYVSSTYQDLKEHREAVRNAVRRMGHVDVAMEHYVAADDRPLDRCLADVREADLYVVVMAWRYGFVPAGGTLSITELEYREAVAEGKPVLAFVLSDEHPWPPKWVEHSPAVAKFRAELLDSRLAGVFTTVDDLGRQVTEALQAHSAQPTSAVDWDLYRQAVADRYRWVRLSVIAGAQDERLAKIPLTDVFVPQDLLPGRPTYDVTPEQPGPADLLDAFATIGTTSRQVLLGGPGSGKSTLFHAYMLDACASSDTVPLLIELRQYALGDSDDFIAHWEKQVLATLGVRVSREAIAEVLEAGRAVVLFDGLDEIFDEAERARVTDQFHAFTRRFPRARIVVSSRIVGYDDIELDARGFDHHTLLGFGLRQVGDFLSRWYEHYTLEGEGRDASSLLRRITDNPRLLELARNPLLLTMMAIIYKHQDLPEKRWQLYARCTDVLLEHWDVKRKKIGAREALKLDFHVGVDEKAEILQRVAHRMLIEDNSELNAISYHSLRDEVAAYLGSQYRRSPGEARALAVEILNHLRERTYVLAEVGDGVFGFVHRTFMEYFAARHVLDEFNGRRADYEWLRDGIYGACWNRDTWREPLLLLSGMLAGQGSPVREVIDHLAGAPRSLPFAVRCLVETGQIPPDDREWAGRLLTSLVGQVRTLLDRRGTDTGLTDRVDAFTQLAALIPVPADTREQIDAMARSDKVKVRNAGWQLNLGTHARLSRRQVALSGVHSEDEAVRRAACIVLEREWAGDEEVCSVLLDRLRSERDTSMCEVLLSAVDRGWPRRPELIDHLLRLDPVKTPHRHLRWLVDHFAVAWAGNPEARAAVLSLARDRPGKPGTARGRAVREAVCRALVQGWGGSSDTIAFLLDRDRRDEQVVVVWALLELDVDIRRTTPPFTPHDIRHVISELCATALHSPAVLTWVLSFRRKGPIGRFALDAVSRTTNKPDRVLLRARGLHESCSDEVVRDNALWVFENVVERYGGEREFLHDLIGDQHLISTLRVAGQVGDWALLRGFLALGRRHPVRSDNGVRALAEAEEALRAIRQNRSREHQLGR